MCPPDAVRVVLPDPTMKSDWDEYVVPARRKRPVRNWYAVSCEPLPSPLPVRRASFAVNPSGTPVCTTQNRRSQLAPLVVVQPRGPAWVSGTTKLQSPSSSETHVAQSSSTGVVGSVVPS